MSFIIEINAKDITTIEEIRENFDIDVLLSHKDDFDVWLAGWDYEDEAAQVRELSPDLSDDDWLKKVCKIIGIPSATLTAAKRKRTSDAKKAEKAKAAEEEKKKESEVKKKVAKKETDKIDWGKLKVDFTTPDIKIVPQCLKLFVCEKGIVYYQNRDKLSISKDGSEFNSFNIYGWIKKIQYVNGYFVVIHGYTDDWNISFSEDGENWQRIDAEDFQQYEPDDDFKPANCYDIIWDGNQYVMLCSQEYRYDEGGFLSSEKWREDYYIAKAESLDGSWKCNDIGGMGYVYPRGLIFHDGKYFVEVKDGHEESGYSDECDDGIYYSDNAVDWSKADETDTDWLGGLRLDADTVAFVNEDDGTSCYLYNHDNYLVYKNQIVFRWKDNKLLAAEIIDLKDCVCGDFRVVGECSFDISKIYLFKDKFVCLNFGNNDSDYEYSIGKINY